MEFKNFIINYWAQLTVLIAAGGYVLKVILDHRYKRKEIWHSIFQQKRMDHLLKYWEQYYKLESDLLGAISICMRTDLNPMAQTECDPLVITQILRSSSQLLSQLRPFVTKGEYKILSSQLLRISESLQDFTQLLMAGKSENDFKNEVGKLYKKTVENTNVSDDEMITFRK